MRDFLCIEKKEQEQLTLNLPMFYYMHRFVFA